MTTLYWDFHGPDAPGTAEHYRRHLEQFLGVNALHGCRTGVREEAPGHHAVWCETPPEWVEAVAKALRPRRRSP